MPDLRRYENILDAIGWTPLVRLNRITKGLRPRIYAKLEQSNPGGSVKDRIGIAMIEDAEKKGLLKPGGTVVEPTSGNTGVGLAMVAVQRGYKMVFTMPDKMSREKIRLLKAYGAEVIVCPTAVPPGHPEHYVEVARRVERERQGAYMPFQYGNPANPESHYLTTGPEIWEQTEGKIDIMVIGMGTGGTITGTGRYLKEKSKNVRVVGVDPEGSLYHELFTTGKMVPAHARPYKIEGIGEDFLPTTMDMKIVDEVVTVTDLEAFRTARRLAREEGILSGSSAGAAVCGALRVAEKIDGDRLMVVLLPDSGLRYLSKFYSDEWMAENGFPL